MRLSATSVGELVNSLARRGAKGKVKRTFRNSAYLESRGGLILLLRGELRSPMTVNLAGGRELPQNLAVKEPFELNGSSLNVGELEIRLGGASIFKSSLLGGNHFDPIGEKETAKFATALKLLYSASPPSLELVRGHSLKKFIESVLIPFTQGEPGRVYRFGSYTGLIGSGTGFTPAGDDFVAGFTATYNHYARGTGAPAISLSLKELRKRTVSESAFLVDYAQRGYVDEELERLILAGVGGEPAPFRAQLSALASRGHTSGLDMSLGVLMAVASLSERFRPNGALQTALEALSS